MDALYRIFVLSCISANDTFEYVKAKSEDVTYTQLPERLQLLSGDVSVGTVPFGMALVSKGYAIVDDYLIVPVSTTMLNLDNDKLICRRLENQRGVRCRKDGEIVKDCITPRQAVKFLTGKKVALLGGKALTRSRIMDCIADEVCEGLTNNYTVEDAGYLVKIPSVLKFNAVSLR